MRHVFSSHERRKSLAGSGLFAAAVIAAVSMVATSHADVITFGSGANAFTMEFVTIGNPGNAANTLGLGRVDYTYGIGKYEVSENMIDKFNASQSLQITKDSRGPSKPASDITWNEAARFVNWLNTSTGGFAAYKYTTGGVNDSIEVWTASDIDDYDPLNRYRSKRAKYVLPSINEWNKAAYYNPNDSTYYDFPNGRNTAPIAVTSGTDDNTAVYNQLVSQGPANVDEAGGLSPYGVMGLGGNVREWGETSQDLTNQHGSIRRGYRGGDWTTGFEYLKGGSLFSFPYNSSGIIGFRVASVSPTSPAAVPEPISMTIVGLCVLGAAYRARRRNTA